MFHYDLKMQKHMSKKTKLNSDGQNSTKWPIATSCAEVKSFPSTIHFAITHGEKREPWTEICEIQNWLHSALYISWAAGATTSHILSDANFNQKVAYKKDREKLFTKACSDRTRRNGFKWKEGRFRLDIKKKLVFNDGCETVQQVAQRSCGSSQPTSVQGQGGWSFDQQSSGKCPCPWQRCWN